MSAFDAFKDIVLDDLHAQQRGNRTLTILLDRVMGLAKSRPALWVIEDAHWIDPTTLELLELTLDWVLESRVLVLVTARPSS